MARRNNRVISASNAENPMMGDYVDMESTDTTVFANKMVIREVIEDARLAATPPGMEKPAPEHAQTVILKALEEAFGYTPDFVSAALHMDEGDRLKQDFRTQVHMEALREVMTEEVPLFTRDSQGDPQLSDAYRNYISAIETFKTRQGLYPERPDDMGYQPGTYDGRDDPDELPFIRMWVVPNALVHWPTTRAKDDRRIIRTIFTMNDLWGFHRDEDMMSPRILLTNIKDHLRRQLDWLDYQIVWRTSDRWIVDERKKAYDLAMGFDAAQKKIIDITTRCAVCRNDAKTCRNHTRIVGSLYNQKDRWLRMANKYLGNTGSAFAEVGGVSRYKRVTTQIKRKAKIRKKTPIGVCWLESWVAGDAQDEINKRIDGEWAIQAFFDAEARGLIELGANGEYEKV